MDKIGKLPMKAGVALKLLSLVSSLSVIGDLEISMSASDEMLFVTVRVCQAGPSFPPIGKTSFWVAGPYAGEVSSAIGDKVIAIVNNYFPELRFVSDAERASPARNP
jgi:hypothetical protein